MRVLRLRARGGPEQLVVEEADRPLPGPAEALVRVHAAAIARGELEWPVDLPAIPCYELSGVVEKVGKIEKHTVVAELGPGQRLREDGRIVHTDASGSFLLDENGEVEEIVSFRA
jgi:NADPH:quinone reductase-like Zn-dependent oxidoreductase